MLRWLVLFAFVPSVTGCHGALPEAPRPSPAPSSPARVVEPARASACRAEPATVYGSEPVVFHIDAARAGSLDVTLVDELGRPAVKSTVAVPGKLEPPSLPSGDFTLHAGSSEVRCVVTVNRELSRASGSAR